MCDIFIINDVLFLKNERFFWSIYENFVNLYMLYENKVLVKIKLIFLKLTK